MSTVVERVATLLRHPHRHRVTTGHVALDRHLCAACWGCVEKCPRGVLGSVEFGRHKHAIVAAADECTGCLACVRTCEAGALTPRTS